MTSTASEAGRDLDHGWRISYASKPRPAVIVQDDALRAPRIISILQRLCEHEKAAKEAAEQRYLISNSDVIA